MLISDLLKSIDVTYKGKDLEIKYITDDSRKCIPNSIFICHENAAKYVEQAKQNGAVAVVAQSEVCQDCIITENTRKAFAVLSSAFFSDSHKKLKLIAVTGTNGKTTVACMIHTIMVLSGKKCGMLTTVCNEYNNKKLKGELTTPDCFTIHRMFSEMVEMGTEYCVLEASSQGLCQMRLHTLSFDVAIFTNLSQDHLDYHKTMENYKQAKLMLFDNANTAIINFDDKSSSEFVSRSKGKTITYSLISDEANYTAKCIKTSDIGSDYAIVANSLIHRMKLNIPGEFNISNSMAAVITSIECGCSVESCSAALRNFYGVKGRMEVVETGKDFRLIIDYAHTPDSMRKVLLSMKNFSKNRVIAVFGCGGDRDKDKRSEMGKTASELADVTIITSDNPRHEEPMKIIEDILSGVKNKKNKVFIKENRTKAIEYALKIAQKNDIILLLGKGHESYVVVGDEKIPYDERDVVRSILNGK